MKFRKNLYELRENTAMNPRTFATVLSNMLYESRFGSFMCEPLVAGLHSKTFESYVSNMDSIGCLTQPEDFVASGNGAEAVMGLAEAYWEKDMDATALLGATAETVLGALEREASCGWGAVVYVVTPEGIAGHSLKARMD